jgi:hypothetical protein
MALEVIADGYVCSDCCLMIANGETGDPDHNETTVDMIAQATAGWCLDDSEHPDQEFSTTPCRTCGMLKYGARHWAVRLGEVL